uniref:G-protein coupled receptors family 1 profile domain-containing protein n=1 Tax=Plectus sambesii TaxID=2011161 RepID=A0A914X6B4_9BILA
MRSTANDILAAMAFADLALLFCMLPNSMAAFHVFANNYLFRLAYLLANPHLSALANWFSAAAIWLMLAVSIERLMGIRSPMHTRFYWKRRLMMGFLVCLFGASGALTFHHHLAYDCSLYETCNGTQQAVRCEVVASEWKKNRTNPYSPLRQQYIKVSTVVNALLVVIVPIAAVTALNITLIRVLKRHDLTRAAFGKINDEYRMEYNPVMCSTSGVSWKLHIAGSCVQSDSTVTVTVCAIVTCFTVTQGPSAIAFIWELTAQKGQTNGHYFNAMISVANNLVITGKVLNFIFFCLSSAHFRRRLHQLIAHRLKFLTLSQARTNHTDSYQSHNASARKLNGMDRHSVNNHT